MPTPAKKIDLAKTTSVTDLSKMTTLHLLVIFIAQHSSFIVTNIHGGRSEVQNV